MRHVTKREYIKAVRTIEAYNKQQAVGKYQFLYWLEDDFFDDEKIKEILIEAKNIDDACEKFLLKKPSDVSKVDYEVMFEGKYIDISDKKEFEDFI